jgi:hypothetical protein
MLSWKLSAAVLVGLASASAACSPASAPNGDGDSGSAGCRIVGGTQASSYPEAVLVQMSQGGRLKAACSGALIAPRVVLTAGHCVHGYDGWHVTAPYGSGQAASSTRGVTLDWTTDLETVDRGAHDLGLVFLDADVTLPAYPTLADAPLPEGSQVIHVGRVGEGQLSTTELFASEPITVGSAASAGYPYDYVADQIIQSGDSGGPDFVAGTHTIVAVNSGAGGGTEVLARVDLALDWILEQLAAQDGGGGDGLVRDRGYFGGVMGAQVDTPAPTMVKPMSVM